MQVFRLINAFIFFLILSYYLSVILINSREWFHLKNLLWLPKLANVQLSSLRWIFTSLKFPFTP